MSDFYFPVKTGRGLPADCRELCRRLVLREMRKGSSAENIARRINWTPARLWNCLAASERKWGRSQQALNWFSDICLSCGCTPHLSVEPQVTP